MSNTPLAFNSLIQQIENGLQLNLKDEKLIHYFLPEFRKLLINSDWLDHEFRQPDPQYYQQYLLYKDPDDRFSIVSFVWGPAQSTPIHNHEVWGVVGVLQGSEISQRYQFENGLFQQTEHADKLNQGDIDYFTPTDGDVHKVSNAFNDQVSISIHIYGADIGKVKRFTFDQQGNKKQFISGYSNKEFKK
nr:cysteine dioxygenase [Acinetobacter sp. Marseille-Q1620]